MLTRVVRAGGLFLLPMLAAMLVAGVTIPGSSVVPWNPNMIDLDVYIRSGRDVLAAHDFYATPDGQLPWIYPPFAVLFTIPFAVMPLVVARLAWLAACVGVLLAMVHRLGFRGWKLSVLCTAVVVVFEPVRDTLGFGQLAILLVGAAVVDSLPGERFWKRRWLPEGVLVGLATAVKLTPATVAAYLFFAGRRKPGLVAFAAFCGATLLGFLLLPQASIHYWGGLVSGNSGINDGIFFKTNQSVMGVWSRLFGELSSGGLIVSAVVAVVGLTSTVLAHRSGEQALALCMAGLTSLLTSPISWSHHYVWAVPLSIVLYQRRELFVPVRIVGLFYCAWVAVGPFKFLPGGERQELSYTPVQHLIANLGVAMGVTLCLLVIWQALRQPRVGVAV